MSDKAFINNYLEDFSSLVKPTTEIAEKIIKAKDILIETKKTKKKL